MERSVESRAAGLWTQGGLRLLSCLEDRTRVRPESPYQSLHRALSAELSSNGGGCPSPRSLIEEQVKTAADRAQSCIRRDPSRNWFPQRCGREDSRPLPRALPSCVHSERQL